MIQSIEQPKQNQLKPYEVFVNTLRRRHRSFADKIAIIEEKTEITFGEFWSKVDEYRLRFNEVNIEEGSVVGIICPMLSIDVVAFLVALVEIGGTPIIVNLTDRFQKIHLQDLNVQGMVLHKNNIKYIKHQKGIDTVSTSLFTKSYMWCEFPADQHERVPNTSLLVTSSGSTSLKKVIKYTADGIMNNIQKNIKALNIKHEDRTLMVLPLTYSYGLIGQFFSHLMVGALIIFSNKQLLTNSIIRSISKHSVTSVFTVPPILRQLNFLIEQYGHLYEGKYNWESLRYITVGGNHIESNSIVKALNIFKCTIIKTYGLAEAGPRVATNIINKPSQDIETVGLSMDNVKVSVIDEDGKTVKPGQIGTLVVETDSICNGYLIGEETGLEIKGNKVFTKDMGLVKPNGQIEILGRKSDLFYFKENEKGIWSKTLADIIYSNFYILKLKIERLENKLRISIVPIPSIKPTMEDVIHVLQKEIGKDITRNIEIVFRKITELKFDK